MRQTISKANFLITHWLTLQAEVQGTRQHISVYFQPQGFL